MAERQGHAKAQGGEGHRRGDRTRAGPSCRRARIESDIDDELRPRTETPRDALHGRDGFHRSRSKRGAVRADGCQRHRRALHRRPSRDLRLRHASPRPRVHSDVVPCRLDRSGHRVPGIRQQDGRNRPTDLVREPRRRHLATNEFSVPICASDRPATSAFAPRRRRQPRVWSAAPTDRTDPGTNDTIYERRACSDSVALSARHRAEGGRRRALSTSARRVRKDRRDEEINVIAGRGRNRLDHRVDRPGIGVGDGDKPGLEGRDIRSRWSRRGRAGGGA